MRETSIVSTLHSSAARLILEVFKILFYSLVEERKKERQEEQLRLRWRTGVSR